MNVDCDRCSWICIGTVRKWKKDNAREMIVLEEALGVQALGYLDLHNDCPYRK